ncbi:MAG TPA: HDOD domain-containing protein [Candidatus Sulfotelmatobacter sp.]|nr:HDOD domain-containing protein [Candidatus Sulfotelmatobacter sp.]
MTLRQVGTPKPSLSRSIRDAVNAGKLTLPPMPPVAAKVLRLLREDYNGPVGPLVVLLSSDPALTTAILRVANSAIFGGLGEVSDLRIAIARLGVREVTAIVTMVAHKANFVSDDPEKQAILHALWDHSIVTAQGARRIGTERGVDGSDAFLAGLLHDTGKLLLFRAFDRLLAEGQGQKLTAAARDELMETLHPELGHHVLSDWRIPESACHVALHHHDAEPPVDDRLLLCVQAANSISRKIGAHTHPSPELNLLEVRAIQRLELTDAVLSELMSELVGDLEHLRQLL